MDERRKILIVDDDRALTGMLSELLEIEGLACSVAHNGGDALTIERKEKPDLVILDVMMPGDDGITTLRSLRQTSSVAVLMLTAMGEDDDRILGLEAGADDYLAKPFVARELVLRVQAIL
ncbi:MAG: response regulator, partial [Woeseia sp.]